MERSVSVIIPTYNEVNNIGPTVAAVRNSLAESRIENYELLILDSGSKDGTADKIKELAAKFPQIRPHFFSTGYDLGKKYKGGIKLSSKNYVAYIPGDDETDHESITRLFREIGTADIILAYTTNPEVRSLKRRLISRAYIFILNFLFGLRIKYYNGTSVFPAQALKKVRVTSNNFSYMSEIVLRLVKSGFSYREVGIKILDKKGEKSHALRFRGFIDTGRTILKLLWDLQIRREKISV